MTEGKRLRLMIPGPVETPQSVLDAIGAPTMPHYGPQFMALLDETRAMMGKLLNTKNEVMLMPGPGTGALGSLIAAAAEIGEGVIVLDNGFFAERLDQIAEGYGLTAYVMKTPWGEALDVDACREFIQETLPTAEAEGHPVKEILVVHHETSTGVLNPLKELAAMANEFDIPLIVDAVASGGGVPVYLDEWGIDGFVTVGNKCMGTPPGLGIAVASQRIWDLARAHTSPRGWYYDLKVWDYYISNWDWHPFPTTMPSNNICALNQALKDIFEMGLESHYQSFIDASAYLRKGMAEMGFDILPDPAVASPTISAFLVPDDFDEAGMRQYLIDECDIIISGGLVSLAGKIFRVGHMGGEKDKALMDDFLAGVKAFMEK